MRATIAWLGGLLLLAATGSTAQAQHYSPFPRYPAPDACGPGYYCNGYYGMAYGPNYNLRPPFPPYNGERLPMPKKDCGGMVTPWGYATHPYARGPRDFFMMD
jgi:hypothetical protein